MSLARRLDALDANLSPTQLVLRWLDEAHGYGRLVTYVRATLDLPGEEQALNRLCREAHDGTRARLRGKPPDQVHKAVRSALKGTVFRFLLVTRINVTTQELVEREALLSMLFAAQAGVLVSDDWRDGRSDGVHRRRLGQVRDLAFFRVDELLANAEARRTVEARYLDGHPVLFPDIAATFEEQLKQSQHIAVMAMRLAELDGVEPMAEPDPDALGARAAQLVADLVEPARSDALDKLGEGEAAFRIARDWLQGQSERPAIKGAET